MSIVVQKVCCPYYGEDDEKYNEMMNLTAVVPCTNIREALSVLLMVSMAVLMLIVVSTQSIWQGRLEIY